MGEKGSERREGEGNSFNYFLLGCPFFFPCSSPESSLFPQSCHDKIHSEKHSVIYHSIHLVQFTIEYSLSKISVDICITRLSISQSSYTKAFPGRLFTIIEVFFHSCTKHIRAEGMAVGLMSQRSRMWDHQERNYQSKYIRSRGAYGGARSGFSRHRQRQQVFRSEECMRFGITYRKKFCLASSA